MAAGKKQCWGVCVWGWVGVWMGVCGCFLYEIESLPATIKSPGLTNDYEYDIS